MAFTLETLTKEMYTTGDVARMFQVTPKTIQKWDKQGLLKFDRSPTNRRIISRQNLIEFLKTKNMFYENPSVNKRDVIYARVSTAGQQKQGDLDRQVEAILNANNDLKNILILKEIGSGLNSKRPKLQKIMKMVMNNEVNRIFVTYEERLTRYGFNLIEIVCAMKDVPIIVLHEKRLESPQQQLVDDMMCLIASFSGKMYGLRSHKNKKEISSK